MLMPKFIRKWRRQLLANQIITTGEKMRKVQASRSGVDAKLWPDDCAYLDAVIDRLERRHSALLRKFKEAY